MHCIEPLRGSPCRMFMCKSLSETKALADAVTVSVASAMGGVLLHVAYFWYLWEQLLAMCVRSHSFSFLVVRVYVNKCLSTSSSLVVMACLPSSEDGGVFVRSLHVRH